MNSKNYIIKNFLYETNLTENIDTSCIEQKMMVTGTFSEDKKYIDIDFNVQAFDTNNNNLFSLKVLYVLELEKAQEDTSREAMKKIIKNFYPNFKKFVEDFYNKESGLEELKLPKF